MLPLYFFHCCNFPVSPTGAAHQTSTYTVGRLYCTSYKHLNSVNGVYLLPTACSVWLSRSCTTASDVPAVINTPEHIRPCCGYCNLPRAAKVCGSESVTTAEGNSFSYTDVSSIPKTSNTYGPWINLSGSIVPSGELLVILGSTVIIVSVSPDTYDHTFLSHDSGSRATNSWIFSK
jgi:hypothetical protein